MANDDFAETKDFLFADRRIHQLLGVLKGKGLCGCCVARALLYHGAGLHQTVMGSAETAETLESLATAMRKDPHPAPDSCTTH